MTPAASETQSEPKNAAEPSRLVRRMAFIVPRPRGRYDGEPVTLRSQMRSNTR